MKKKIFFGVLFTAFLILMMPAVSCTNADVLDERVDKNYAVKTILHNLINQAPEGGFEDFLVLLMSILSFVLFIIDLFFWIWIVLDILFG